MQNDSQPRSQTLRARAFLGHVGRSLAILLMTLAAGILVCATLLRFAPGFDSDERQLDLRLNHESVAAMRAQHSQNRNVLAFYVRYISGALHGEFGDSVEMNRPVRQLIAERLPVTAGLSARGIAIGWLLAAAMAFAEALVRHSGLRIGAVVLTSTLLCIPTTVLAVGFVILRAPAFLAIALVIFPQVLVVARNLIRHSYESPHILTGRAKGIAEWRILFWHVLPGVGRPLIALAGLSVSMALGAAIPVEALCGIPGIGQLAWQSALGRDLPTLVSVTALVIVATLCANLASDLVNEALELRSA